MNREQFEAWWEVNYHNGNPPRFGWSVWRDGDGYKIDDDESELDGMWNAWQAATNAMEAKCATLAAESLATNDRLQKLIQIISNADNDYCMCGDSMKSHVHGGCGHPTGMFDYHYNQWLESDKETPATDAFLAEVRAGELDSLAGVAETMLVKFSNQQCSSDMHEVVGWKMVHQQASNRAAQLRQEAAQ